MRATHQILLSRCNRLFHYPLIKIIFFPCFILCQNSFVYISTDIVFDPLVNHFLCYCDSETVHKRWFKYYHCKILKSSHINFFFYLFFLSDVSRFWTKLTFHSFYLASFSYSFSFFILCYRFLLCSFVFPSESFPFLLMFSYIAQTESHIRLTIPRANTRHNRIKLGSMKRLETTDFASSLDHTTGLNDTAELRLMNPHRSIYQQKHRKR